MISFDFSKECYSCSVCKYVCPKGAIEYDDNLYPVVNSDLCIGCGICEKHCINLHANNYDAEIHSIVSYIARSKDDEIRKNSSSGGIFFLLAQNVLKNGGSVCGCVFDRDFLPHHVMAYDIDSVIMMMGSKYVMSDMGNCIELIANELNKGKKVLFSGVPCQIAALLSSVPDTRNLYLVAIVCHGSISRDIWKRYLQEECGNRTISSISMRDKTHGWLNYGLKIIYKNGEESITYRLEDGYFLKCFTDGVLARDRCLSCKYKGTNIRADILLGDAWGIEKMVPEMNDTLGASSVICLTEKGFNLVEEISEKLERKEINAESIVDNNKRIVSPPKENPLKLLFNIEMRHKKTSLLKLLKKYSNPSFLFKVFSKVTRSIM